MFKVPILPVLWCLRTGWDRPVIKVGASMGGFGALLHGGLVADAVVAFNPQAWRGGGVVSHPRLHE